MSDRPPLEEQIEKAKPVGAPIPALRTAAQRELEQTGLIDLQEGFSAPADWAATNQEYMESLRQAQFEGAENSPEIGPDYISVEWKNNYQNETRGPSGETLPKNALGWLPTGKPDFGGGFKGVLESAWYNLYEKPRGEIKPRDIGAYGPTATSLRDDLNERLSRDVAEEDVGKEFLGVAGTVLSHGIQYIKDIWATAEDNETIFGKTTQFIGAGFDLVAGAFEESAKVVETKVIGPQALAADELLRRGAESGILTEEGVAWKEKFRPLGGFGILAPIVMVWKLRAQGFLEGREYIKPGELGEIVDRNRDAARMAYTAWFDPAAGEEYIRRLRGGEDPRLLALELENPGAEMVGRIIYDPANIFDIFQIGSIVRNTLRANRFRKELTTIASPELEKALDAFAAVGETGKSSASRAVINALGGMYDATREGRVEVAGRRGFFRATAGGKRATYGQRANNFMSTIIAVSGNDPDLANSVWRGLTLAADTDDARRVEGLTILSQAIADSKGALTPGILFSPSANETAILLRNLLLDDAGEFNPGVILKILEDGGDNPEKLAVLLDRKLNDALAKDFPTIQDQVKLNEEYGNLLKADEAEAARFLERNPLANQDPGAFYKSLAKADDFLQPIYRPMGEFQARLFMGVFPNSWRYRANNRWGNFMPTLIDVGPEPAIKGLLKGFPGFQSGWSPQASMDEIARNLGGVLPEGAVRGLGPAKSFRGGELFEAKEDWLNRVTTAGLRGAAEDEAANAVHVVNKSVQRSMKSYMKAERRILNKELSMLSDDQRNLVAAAMRENYFDGDKAFDALRSQDGYDVSRNLAFLSDDEIEELRELRMYDAALLAVRENDDLDDVLRTIDEIMEERSRVGTVAGGEAPAFNMEDVAGESISRESHIPKEYENVRATDAHMRRRKEVNEFDRLYEEALFGPAGLQRMATEEIMRSSLIEGARIGMTDEQKIKMAMAQLDGVTGPLQQEIRIASDATMDSSRAFTVETWTLSDGSKGRKAGDSWLIRKWMERDAIAKQFGLPGLGPPPSGLKAQQLRDALWQHETSSYYKIQDARWTQLRDQNLDRYREVARRLAGAAGIEDFHTPAVNAAEAQLIRSRMMDRAELAADGTMVIKNVSGVPEDSIQIYRVTERGQPPGNWATTSIEQSRGRAGTGRAGGPTGDMETAWVTPEEWDRAKEAAVAENARRGTTGEDPREGFLSQIDTTWNPEGTPRPQATEDMPVVGSMDDAAPTPYRVFHETQPAAVDAAERLKQGLRDNWGQTGRMGALDPDTEQEISKYLFGQRGRKTEARAQAIGIANETRDFILHNYPKRFGADLVAGYIWPYQFWYSRTYAKWMLRMIQHPGMVAAYSHYRNALEKKHAGLPAWWRRNINVTDLLGIETDSPLWFNLERSLNPIQGLTGVDFTDPKRRLDNWSATVEDINKFGPSVWMPYNVALALKYSIDGEEEAASRWAGRLWSPTGTIRDLTALIDPKGLGIEIDPFTQLFGGGIGPWERGRIGRQFGAAQTEGQYSQAELIDAARTQEGPIWDEMRARAINQRAPNLPLILAPFFLGSGFKMRTESDAQIDQFYSEMIGLMRTKEDLEPEEYRQAWNELERRYPFMDVLLLSKKSGLDRDEALAWSVLDRIPPAMTDDIADLVGINKEVLDLFHESNGNLEEMAEADRLQFLGAILEMAAILDVPDNATKAEWETAKALRYEMIRQGEELFGEDIWERVDAWWAVFDPENRGAADAMMARDPSIQQAQDWQQRMIMSTPLLGAYYTSEERIRKFYKRQMYDAAGDIFGEDLWDHFTVYNELKDMGEAKAARQYWKDHPQMEGYVNMRDQTLLDIEAKVNRIGSLLPEAAGPIFRDKEMGDIPDGPPEPTSQDWINAQVLTYATGQQQDDAPEDVRDFVREQADNLWPGTRADADLYYQRLDKKLSVAQKMLMHNSALAARVAWESEALRQLTLVQEGRFAETGAQAQAQTVSPTWMEWQPILSLPMWRLARDNLRYGDSLTSDEEEELVDVATGLGISFDELMTRLQGAYEEAEGSPVEDKMAVPPTFVPLIAEAKAQLRAQGFYTRDLLGRIVDAGIAAGLQEDDSVNLLERVVGKPTAQGLQSAEFGVPVPPEGFGGPLAGFASITLTPEQKRAGFGGGIPVSERSILSTQFYGTNYTDEFRNLLAKVPALVDPSIQGGGAAGVAEEIQTLYLGRVPGDTNFSGLLKHELAHVASVEFLMDGDVEKWEGTWNRFQSALRKTASNDIPRKLKGLSEPPPAWESEEDSLWWLQYWGVEQGHIEEIPAELFAEIVRLSDGDYRTIPQRLRPWFDDIVETP